jgi:hypothetical protein
MAFALAICLGLSPLWAAQDQQEVPPEAVQQSPEESAPETAPQAPPTEYLEVPPTLTVPAGTTITIRTSQYLSSDQNHAGDAFSAELQQPVVVHGWVLARRGQTVLGRVAVAKKAGRIKGQSQLGVELTQLVLVDGQQLPIRTQLMQTSGGTTRGSDAAAVGTTGSIGAAIGAAADGGAGAGIGAAIGAGAGLAGVLLTRGRPTVIPAETSLTFRLEFPLTISTARSRVAFRPVEPEDYKPGGTLQRRPDHFAVAPPTRPPYWGGYYPWGYYPGPFFVGYYRFGRYGHGRHRRW